MSLLKVCDLLHSSVSATGGKAQIKGMVNGQSRQEEHYLLDALLLKYTHYSTLHFKD